jgi:hypothetical protein
MGTIYDPRARDIYAIQDDLLISVEDGHPLRTGKLKQLPPWRAVMVARVALKAGVPMEQGTVKQIVAEAVAVGGDGTLGNWWERKVS